jgi:hypothetical protein
VKRLSDSEIVTLTLFQRLRGVESERSFLRDAARFFAHLFPGVVGLAPSSLHRRIRKLRRFLELLRRSVLSELVGDPETLTSSTRRCCRSCTRARRSGGRRDSRGPRGGEVGLLLGLRGKVAPAGVRHQPGADLLRAYGGQRGGGR